MRDLFARHRKTTEESEWNSKVGSAIMLNKIFVDYDGSKVSIEEIRKAIREAGYSNYVTNDDSMR